MSDRRNLAQVGVSPLSLALPTSELMTPNLGLSWKDTFCLKKRERGEEKEREKVHSDKTISFLTASPLMSGLKYEVIRGY